MGGLKRNRLWPPEGLVTTQIQVTTGLTNASILLYKTYIYFEELSYSYMPACRQFVFEGLFSCRWYYISVILVIWGNISLSFEKNFHKKIFLKLLDNLKVKHLPEKTLLKWLSLAFKTQEFQHHFFGMFPQSFS